MEGGPVALATAADAVDHDDDLGPLVSALARRGVRAQPVVWDDPAVDWRRFARVVLRSTWDYPRRHRDFLAWTAGVDRAGALRNRAGVVAWNTDKRYLRELAAAGVPVVETHLVEPGAPVPVPAAGGDGVVVKPAVSAGAQDTVRHDADDADAIGAHVARLHAQGRVAVVQPYVADVDQAGETALVFLADRFSHAIRKGPLLDGSRATVGGLFSEEDIRSRVPSAAERAVAERTLDALPHDRRSLLYARVDLLPDAERGPVVLEVELVEPSLFLATADGAAERFAAAIAEDLRRSA